MQVTIKEDGTKGLAKGWAPTFIGYSMQVSLKFHVAPQEFWWLTRMALINKIPRLLQGMCKFGFYEVFKIVYSGLIGEENTYLWRTSLYLAASASAEFFADIALSPMESVKVKLATGQSIFNWKFIIIIRFF